MKYFQLLSIVIPFLLAGCQESSGPSLPQTGGAAPGKVTNVKVKNIAGGARIFYTVPNSKDFNYVKAVYTTKAEGEQSVKASRYRDSLAVHGFYNASPKKVTLYAYSIGGKASDSVSVTIHPRTPPFKAVFNSLKTKATFGGLKIQYSDNIDTTSLTIEVIKDSSGFMLPVRNRYVKKQEGEVSIHGLQARNTKFGFVVRDQYKNRTDTLFQNLKPLYEVELDKSLWSNAKLPTDIWKNYKHYAFEQMWDDASTSHAESFETDKFDHFPMWFTINLGQKAKISRFIFYRQPHWTGYNPKKIEVWGSTQPNIDPDHPFNSSWFKYGTYVTMKPSYDVETPYPANGVNFQIKNAPIFPDAQYIRIKVLNTTNGGYFLDMGELTFFGQPKNPANE